MSKVPCTQCGALILTNTAERTGGLCMPCQRGTRAEIDEAKRLRASQPPSQPPGPATPETRKPAGDITPADLQRFEAYASTLLAART